MPERAKPAITLSLEEKVRARRKTLDTIPAPFPAYTTGTMQWDNQANWTVNTPVMEVRTKGKKDPIMKIETPRKVK